MCGCGNAAVIGHIEALGILGHYGIRVVRAKYVDSAEDAIAFAARRDARDRNSVPIVLRVLIRDTLRGGPLLRSARVRFLIGLDRGVELAAGLGSEVSRSRSRIRSAR